jgi:hypothetical protein
VPQASEDDRTLPFGCNDLVVIGRVENGTFQHVDIDGDILGHGWATAKLKVRRVIRGPNLPSVLPVRYFAHTYMRDDQDFMLVLSRSEKGDYTIETGQLMWLRPHLADQCS